MSKNVAMFVDVANMYYAARGQDVDVDYVALLKHATKGRDLIRAYAYTGLDPENENQRKFIDFLAKNGYKPVVKDIRKFGDGRMKANLDIELVVDLFRLADRMDIAVIVSGDGDFAPAIRALQDKGVRCEVISFKPNTSSDLIAVADEFMDIMKVASISRKEGTCRRATAMSAPEMPAKEVTPEFGFREASPSVAAAALAALKRTGAAHRLRQRSPDARRTGRAAQRRRGAARPSRDVAAAGDRRRRRRSPRVPRGAPSPPPPRRTRPWTDATRGRGAAGGRHRRRGDRLGGVRRPQPARRRRGDEDREFTFEEADAATLAELGLMPRSSPPWQPDACRRGGGSRSARSPLDARSHEGRSRGRGGPATRRRSRSADPLAQGQVGAAGAEGDQAEAPPRAAARPSEADAAPAAEAGRRRSPAAARARRDRRPSRVSRGRRMASGEPQGIWGRFRSARKPRGSRRLTILDIDEGRPSGPALRHVARRRYRRDSRSTAS